MRRRETNCERVRRLAAAILKERLATRMNTLMRTIEEVTSTCEAWGVSPGRYWEEAMGGDMAPQPEDVVYQIIVALGGKDPAAVSLGRRGRAVNSPAQRAAAAANGARSNASLRRRRENIRVAFGTERGRLRQPGTMMAVATVSGRTLYRWERAGLIESRGDVYVLTVKGYEFAK